MDETEIDAEAPKPRIRYGFLIISVVVLGFSLSLYAFHLGSTHVLMRPFDMAAK